jgi:type IV pilus assembly protein PilV
MTRSQEAGFTLMEVMIAMLITAIAIIGIVALFMTQTSASSFSRHQTEATVLGEDKIEQLRALGSAATQTGRDTNLDERGSAGSGIYHREWTETAGVNFADMTVTVRWDENGVPKFVTLRGRRNL